MINIKETQKWYAKERGITVEEFDDYDSHVCRVANAYGNVVKNLTIPVVGLRSVQLACELCGSENIIDNPVIGINCEDCNPQS